LRAGDPARFAALQKELALRYARLVKPGGWLVYATCSIGRTENADVAELVAREGPGLYPLPLSLALGEDRARALGAEGNALQLLPHRHGTDGFFVAAFARAR
jgi:16S rRNA (cytosine967-C5)-methyltransferase